VVSVSITGLPSSLAFGAPPAPFTVTISNGTSTSYANVGMVISLEHCSCNNFPVGQAPAGTMQRQNPATGQWQNVTYDTEGGGMDYIYQPVVTGITLSAGATLSYTFRIAFDSLSQQGSGWFDGTTAADVTLEQGPVNELSPGLPTLIGSTYPNPAATGKLAVTTG
jgi:hypothetical protein